MSTQSTTFKFDDNNIISVISALPSVNQGDTIQFNLENSSGNNIDDWGLYFNNPFEVSSDSEKKYSAGAVTNNNTGSLSKTVANASGAIGTPKYSSYLVYVRIGSNYYTKDPEIIVNDGDVED